MKRVEAIGALLFAVALLSPFVLTLFHALEADDVRSVNAISERWTRAFELWVSATFWRSVVAAAVASLLATLLGSFLARFLGGGQRRSAWRLIFGGILLAPVAMPPVFLGGIFSDLTGFGPAPLPGTANQTLRWGALVLTWALSFAPLLALWIRHACDQVPRAEIEAAYGLGLRGKDRFYVVWRPHLVAPIALSLVGCMAFALSDLSTPPHFGVHTVASDIAFGFQTSLDSRESAAAILPLWLAMAWLLSTMLWRTERPRSSSDLPVGEGIGPLVWGLCLLLVLLAWGTPLVHCVKTSESLSWARHGTEFAQTVKLLIFATVLGMVLGLGALVSRAIRVRSPSPWRVRGTVFVAGMIVAAPGLAVGLAGVAVSSTLPILWEDVIWTSTLAIRLISWIVIVVAVAGGSNFESAAALGLNATNRIVLALRTTGVRWAILAGCVGAAALMREVDLWAVFSLPDSETTVVRATQLMHYGFRSDVAERLVVHGGLAVLWGLIAFGALERRRRS